MRGPLTEELVAGGDKPLGGLVTEVPVGGRGKEDPERADMN